MARVIEDMARLLTTIDPRLVFRGTDYDHSNVFVDFPKLERTDLQVVVREQDAATMGSPLPISNKTFEVAVYSQMAEAESVVSTLYQQIRNQIGLSYTGENFLLLKVMPNEQDYTFTGLIIGDIVRFWFSINVFYRML